MNPEKKEKAKQFELETKLVHAAHTEKGKVLVRSKGPNENENKASWAAASRHLGSVIFKSF